MKNRLYSSIFAALASGGTFAAEPHEAALHALIDSELKTLTADKLVIEAIRNQNSEHASMSSDQILALDTQWRAETAGGSGPLIDKVLAKALSKYLSAFKRSKQGLVTEVFVMDSKGLNVGQSDVTSDYWQGDEAKWQKTYLAGADAIHIGEVELDESSQTYQVQVSFSIVHSGKVIGAATIGVDVEQLMN